MFAIYFLSGIPNKGFELTYLRDIFQSLANIKFSFIESLIFIIVAYVFGHLLAYVSSVTIEIFTLWYFGYPSEFLLGQRKRTNYWHSIVSQGGTYGEGSRSSLVSRLNKIIDSFNSNSDRIDKFDL